MQEFFNHISHMDKTIRNVSMIVVDGPDAGEKALWHASGFVYTSASIDLWQQIAPDLSSVTHAKLQTYGEDTVFFEVLSSQPRMIICGCGHVSMSIIKLGKMLGFHVTAIDDRPLFCDNARRAQADEVICNNFEDGLAQISDDRNNYYIIVTRGHRYDVTCLKKLLHRPHTYIGMMGSRFRIRQLKAALIEEGFDPVQLDQVHMPIGLAIHAETPEEIAVSIMGEIIQIKNDAYATYAYPKDLLMALTGSGKAPEDIPAFGRMALAVIIRRRGSAPRSAGTKMLITESGRCIGTIGGGCAEAAVIQKALRCIKDQTSTITHVDMTGRDAEEEGMVCGGVIDVWIESITDTDI